MSVTMREVAAKAGVTPTVVSRVLHNKATAIRVSEATAERVRQAAIDLGYRVNIMARNFRERQTMMIGVLHGVGFERPLLDRGPRYFASLMDGFIEGAFENGYSITLCPKLLGQTPEDAMSDGRFDGLVWYSTHPSEENREMLRRCSVPMVLIHTRAAEYGNRYPSVTCDNDQGVGLAIDHLVELGHKKIGFAYEAHIPFSESFLRAEAFRSHMSRHGLRAGECELVDASDLDNYFAQTPRHTAILGHNETLAALVMQKAIERGISVPQQLSVVGFDSTAYCEELSPKLTSIYQPLAEMGRDAINLLVQSMSGQKPDPLELIYPCSLDIRGSTSIPIGE
ncbi:MAG: LacI family DNA-binding transcriptional regulator [Fimbriimonas sp.]